MNKKNSIERICHITSVHPRYDIRIFEKECKSLSKYYDVQLVVADGLENEIKNGINIIDVGKEKNRFQRMLISTWKIYKVLKTIDALVFHFHDPELIPVGILLKFRGKKIIFDVHEDIYEQIKTKDWVASIILLLLLPLVKIINKIIAFNFNLIFAELSYKKKYSKRKNKYQIDVLNYPQTEILKPFINCNRTENGIIYIGSITYLRGLDVILDSLMILKQKKIDFTMHFVGTLQEEIDWEYYKILRDNVIFYGYLDIRKGYEISTKCKVGLAILKPIGNYIESIPTKIFEYMSLKLPFIASDFKAWRNYFPENVNNIYVNPNSPIELSEALINLLGNNKRVNQLDDNRRKVAEQKFSWESEEKKLFMLYDNILT